jgi:hypothetical protein
MASRQPEQGEVRIELPTGDDWILVKAWLSWGETNEAHARLFKTVSGATVPDYSMVEDTQIIAYLIDWSLTDAQGAPIVIRRKPVDAILAAVRGLTQRKGKEVALAVAAHIASIEMEKNGQGDETGSLPRSVSVA